MLPVRRSIFRPHLLLPRRETIAPSAHALSPCRPRCSSTFCPTNIAELLRPSPLASSSQRTPPDGETLSINGYVRTVRKQKRIAFAAIGDGSTLQTVQAVLAPQLAEGLSTGVAVAVTGKWTPSPGQEQSHELQVESVRVLGENDATTYPIQKKYQSPEFLRTLPHLRSRLPFNSLILRLRSLVTAQVTNYFAKHDFVQCHPPIITSSDCEGAGEVFTVAPEASSTSSQQSSDQVKQHEDLYFGSPKYLTVSSQLHLEALALSVNKVWALSPTFRAEKSDTARHLSEFYMLEAELAFVEDVKDVMDVVEDMLRAIATELQSSTVGQELLEAREREQEQEGASLSHRTLAQRWQGLVDGPWPRITYDEAIQHLKDAVTQGKAEFEFAPGHEDGLQTEHERYLAESHGRGGPIFVTDYPRNIKPFYMAPSTDLTPEGQTASTVACFDLLVPEICELVGGSMREHRLPELLESMREHGFEAPDGNTEATEGSLQCYEALPPNFSLSANMLAGAFAGIAEHSVMYPVDLLKTRMQIVNPSPSAMYSGISNAMVTISRAEGFSTLWRGLSSVVMGAGPAHAVYFASYEATKHALGGNEGGSEEHHPFAAAASGAAATISSDALMNPFDVIKQRMQLHGSIYKSVPQCAQQVFRTEGIGAFYISYPTTLCMTVPFTALQFMAYESMSKVMNPTGRYDPYTHCFAGGIAGGFAAGLTTPLDVIKTLLQTRGNATDAELRNVSGLLQAAKIIHQREGYKGYFRGLKPRIITTMPSTAICWSAYEMAKAFFIRRSTNSATAI
ncbi:asparaginyl-tRNA synthetase [Cucurbitaria berberidis CBS 394.84]|uniref:asparagine--tRNA ligase n=1 Tax=Cucurbitaria berberidis CBS 394.84 TaxID=1168544 RepID=A0A9P4GDG2_9PLEO|nr:asparaginyl-tRNA synthetase [Cucurbitaria berberidis CBS 394.84]KAF1843898.1 asparaginyl-tRNA synthetase [Cucurbitaria berberidis CBS 394.84]